MYMKLVLLGAPGAGKGTQAKKISLRYGIPHLSTGDLLRNAIRDGTSAGKEAEGFMSRGELVPDHVVLNILENEVNVRSEDHHDEQANDQREELIDGQVEDQRNGFILDGFPRSIDQARALDDLVELDIVVNIDVDLDLLMKRLTGRRSCSSCGAVFHIMNNPPREEGICDQCGSGLTRRKDDNEETVGKRIETYLSQTQPLIDHYKDKGILRIVDGNGEINKIFEEIALVLDDFRVSCS